MIQSNKKLYFLYFSIIIYSCSSDLSKGEKAMQDGMHSQAISLFKNVTPENKNYSQALEYIQECSLFVNFKSALYHYEDEDFYKTLNYLEEIPINSKTDSLFPELKSMRNKTAMNVIRYSLTGWGSEDGNDLSSTSFYLKKYKSYLEETDELKRIRKKVNQNVKNIKKAYNEIVKHEKEKEQNKKNA